MKRIAILGSTGSIGKSTLSIVESFPDRFSVVSMAAGNNVDLAFEQGAALASADIRRWPLPKLPINLQDNQKKAGLNNAIQVTHGSAGTVKVSTHPDADFVVSAIVGVAGLEATYEAVKAGKSVGLANKECLVAAGDLITVEARKQGKPLLPIDSEHNAIHQCMRGGRRNEVQRVWLTASGGPFFHTPASDFSNITVAQALNHPTWKMGRRITIDSATLMNKGFEVIEACRLFHMPPSQISVLIHPQSTIHSLVEFVDGSLLAQLSVTDMRLPILYALTYPDRIESELRFPVQELAQAGLPARRTWEKFPCLRLAYEAVEAGGGKDHRPERGRDEVAVAAFLEGSIGFVDIPATIEAVVSWKSSARVPESIEQVLSVDADARRRARLIGFRVLAEAGKARRSRQREIRQLPKLRRGLWNRF